LTGRYQQRFGHEFNPGNLTPRADKVEVRGLPTDEATIADLLEQEGYKTGIVGKWHLGYVPKFHPLRRGFDEFFGFIGGAHPYLDPTSEGRPPILRGEEGIEESEYLTEAFAREAVAFIDRWKKDPFFLYLSFNAVHGPLQAAQKYLDRFPNIADEKRRTYAGMVSAMDDAIGRVLTALEAAGLARETLVFFINDNGGPTPVTTADNRPLRATKGTVYEGGIRVPFIVKWPNRWPEGKEYDRPVISLDILPTALSAAGARVPANLEIDGVDLTPFLNGTETRAPHERLYWRFGAQSAIRQENWKLVLFGRKAPTALYDLSNDPGEEVNLAPQSADKVEELTASLTAWKKTLKAPLWEGIGYPRWLEEAP
jgi:arylsulfatase A-like enzyme